MDGTLEVIEAFADGEPVDPSRLKSALADSQGRDHLIDILVLRGLIGGQAWPRTVANASGILTPAGPLGWTRWLPAAAVVALICGITGYVAGARSTGPVRAHQTTAVPAAPAPTQVIQLRNGVDWTERVGGN